MAYNRHYSLKKSYLMAFWINFVIWLYILGECLFEEGHKWTGGGLIFVTFWVLVVTPICAAPMVYGFVNGTNSIEKTVIDILKK